MVAFQRSSRCLVANRHSRTLSGGRPPHTWQITGSLVAVALLLIMPSCSSEKPSADKAASGGRSDGSGTKSSDGANDSSPQGVKGRPAAATFAGPITGGAHGYPSLATEPEVLSEAGYLEEEYFVSGVATAYVPETGASGELSADGLWQLAQGGKADFTTRIVVRRPSDSDAFNGTVFVEWLNVSSALDAEPDFAHARTEVMRSGAVEVAVSAQRMGIEGGTPPVAITDRELALKSWDPVRYAPLSHPGDEYAFDIFSQVADSLRGRSAGGIDPLDGLEPTRIFAMGESQSAGRLASYFNGVHPLVRTFDGFLIHSRPGGATGFGSDMPAVTLAPAVLLRNDSSEPVIQLVTESDLGLMGFEAARQPDGDGIRTWEMAGTAHLDTTVLSFAAGTRLAAEAPGGSAVDAMNEKCGQINDGPQRFFVRAALAALDAWSREGEVPPSGTPLPSSGGAIDRDPLGIAKGGVRSAAVDVPLVANSGTSTRPEQGLGCMLLGSSAAISPDVIADRYGGEEAYVGAVEDAVDANVEAGFLLPDDSEEILEGAAADWASLSRGGS